MCQANGIMGKANGIMDKANGIINGTVEPTLRIQTPESSIY